MGAAARARADGYTLLFTSSVLVVNPLIYKTITEQGYADFVAEIFTALLAPAGTPGEVVQRLTADVAKLARDPAVVAMPCSTRWRRKSPSRGT